MVSHACLTGLALLSFSLVAGASSPPEHTGTGRLGARRASSPAHGTTVAIKGADGRRDSHSGTGTTTIAGHSCPAKHVSLYLKEGQSVSAGTCGDAGWCNTWSTPGSIKNCTTEGAVCYSVSGGEVAYCSKEAGTALRQTNPFTADKVGSYACVSCGDWIATGPECKRVTTQLDGLCSNRKWKKGECLVESVSVERWEAMNQAAPSSQTIFSAEYCEEDTKALCAFVGGAPKADACKADGSWCDTITTFGYCDTDAHCAARVESSDGQPVRCCDSDAKLLEHWSAKVCDGVTIKGDDLITKMALDDGYWSTVEACSTKSDCISISIPDSLSSSSGGKLMSPISPFKWVWVSALVVCNAMAVLP